MKRPLLLTALIVLSFGCGSSKGSSSGTGGAASGNGGAVGSGGATSGSGGAMSGSGGSGSPARASVLQHHNDLARDGLYVDAALTQAAAANMAIDTSFAGAMVTGNVYAQPLYLAGSGSTPDQVIVATEADNVYGFNAATGAQVWTKSVGTAVASNALPCGTINPLGVTGTPVIDGSSRIVYLDAMTTDPTATAKHMVHALDADTGAEVSGWPVDLNAMAKSGSTAFQSTLQNQRAALTLVGGKVFVPFSGHIGDCDGYHGWMVGVSTSNASLSAWATRAVAGGIWGSTGAASDGTSLYFATGNSKSSASAGPNSSSGTMNSDWADWGDSETVFRFPTTLVSPATAATPVTTDFFAASNWVDLDKADADMGGTSPILVKVPGATPSALVVALGKDSNAYLLDPSNLGGMDATPLAKTKVSTGVIISAAAAYTTPQGTYVVFRGAGSSCPAGGSGGLVALKISAANPPTVTTAWCGGPTGAGSPAVSQTDTSGSNTIVWAVGSDNKLHGVDGDTGTSVFAGGSTAMSAVQSIQTPIVANGRIFVASNSQVYAWKAN